MNKEKKINWFANIIYFNLSKLFFKRDPRLWVYGSLSGKKYDDNSKYFFEYINENHSDIIRSVWLAKDMSVVDDVKGRGGEAPGQPESQAGRSQSRAAGRRGRGCRAQR